MLLISQRAMRVFVLLFNARTENEGIHTLKMGDRDIVLMFESEDDATRYGLMLEAQDFASPTVEGIEDEEVEEFCRSAGYESKLVPDGVLELPPEASVEKTDLELEAEQSAADLPESTSRKQDPQKQDFSESELDQIRRRLEGLL